MYQSRPKSCKTYPNWESIWESEDSLNNEIAQCPGLKLAVKKYQDINQKNLIIKIFDGLKFVNKSSNLKINVWQVLIFFVLSYSSERFVWMWNCSLKTEYVINFYDNN